MRSASNATTGNFASVISFTVETDLRLPTHFERGFDDRETWIQRIGGIRAIGEACRDQFQRVAL